MDLTVAAFGIRAQAEELPGEREQNFRLVTDAGDEYVLKLSDPRADRSGLLMQERALHHLQEVDPELPVPRVVPGIGGVGTVVLDEGGGIVARLFTYLPGREMGAGDLSLDGLFGLGALAARLGRALRAFHDPGSDPDIIWNPRRLPEVAGLIPWVDGANRGLVAGALEEELPIVRRATRELRSQVIHGDLSLSNLLFGPGEALSGVIDFGDLCHAPLAWDLAVACESTLHAPDGRERLAAVVAGYTSVTWLADEDLASLPHLLRARWATLVAVSAWRARAFPATAEYVSTWHPVALALLESAAARGMAAWAREVETVALSARGRRRQELRLRPLDEMIRARRRLLGSAISDLFYDAPLHLVRGRGARVFDRAGREYLDAYNNVPVVGHGNPVVARAIRAQTELLNTNTRYLYEPVLELAGRLTASLPAGLDTVMFVNSGSEANELAWRLARAHSGGDGAVVTRHAYHGMTAALGDFSPDEWRAMAPPSHVALVDPPDGFRGQHRREQSGWELLYAAQVEAAVSELGRRGHRPAALFMDCAFTSEGVILPPAGYLAAVYARWRAAGGLVVADEVQTGFGRLGGTLWGLDHHGVVPDIVTLGKPMGNGYPTGAVVTRSDIVDSLAARSGWFSTFGGNPVASRAALAVLDQLQSDRFLSEVAELGEHLRRHLEELSARQEAVGDVRALGLLAGVELVQDRVSRAPNPDLCRRVVNEMRSRGVLVGRAGRDHNVVKIRPPLVVGRHDLDLLVRTLGDSLDAVTASG